MVKLGKHPSTMALNAKQVFSTMKLTMEESFPVFPVKATVYTLCPIKYDESDVKRIAKENFQMDDADIENVKQTDNFYYIKDEKNEYQLNVEKQDGTIWYYKPSSSLKRDKLLGRLEDYPDKNKCIAIAEDYLDKRKLSVDAKDVSNITLTDNTTSCGMTIGILRKIDNIEVLVQGEHISVDILRDGSIGSMFKLWSPVKPHAIYPLKTPFEALNAIKHGNCIMYGGPIYEANEEGKLVANIPKEGKVVLVKLSYLKANDNYDSNFLVPYYRFGISYNGGGMVCYACALPDKYVQEM